MGKLADPALKLRCYHCQSTETPLWRAGPDGPKTLCNACGVRFKKGKLILYKDKAGNLTAVKRVDVDPVHVPPAPKKPSKKIVQPPPPAPQLPPPAQVPIPEVPLKRAVRKVPSEGTIAAAVAKKPRSRLRRTNAGQMPGRYASKTLPDSMSQWRSPVSSPRSSPSSPAESPRLDAEDFYPRLSTSPATFRVEEPSLYQFADREEENMFPDVACLGIDSVGDSDNLTLPPMPADPSSAEQFSFAFAELGRDATLEVDGPDRVEALRQLVVDGDRMVSESYSAAVAGLRQLCEQRQVGGRPENSDVHWTIEDCKNFVRFFAQEQNIGLVVSANESRDVLVNVSSGFANRADRNGGLMLSEKTAYSCAVEKFRALMDSVELVGFAEASLVEVLADDVVLALTKLGWFSDFGKVAAFRRRGTAWPNKPISAPG